MKIAIFGSGYVGLVTGVCLADLCNYITFVDIDKKKLDLIKQCKPPIYEEGLEDLLIKNQSRISVLESSLFNQTDADIIFICVGTPPNPDGSPNYEYLKTAARTIATAVKETSHPVVVVVKSTVLPGTTVDIIQPILEQGNITLGNEFGLAMNPEFLKEGVAVHDFMHPDRIIIGTTDEFSKKVLDDLYHSFTCQKLFTSPKAAEMIKFVSNAFLATKISFANEIGNICKQIGIDTEDVFNGVGLDARINPAFFASGIGFGGSCFPKDVQALISFAAHQNIHPKILPAVLAVNDEQPGQMIKLLKKHISDLHGRTIGILGLSFKPASDDIRESRAIPVIASLLKEGADIIAYDPFAADRMKEVFPSITYASKPDEVLRTDAVLITTAHQEFEELDYSGRLVIDGRRVQTATTGAAIYEGVCW